MKKCWKEKEEKSGQIIMGKKEKDIIGMVIITVEKRNKEERDMEIDIIQREKDIQRQWEDSKIKGARYNKRYKIIGQNLGGPRYLRIENMDNIIGEQEKE